MNINPQQESPLVANQASVAQQGGPSCCAPQNKNQPGVPTASNNTETTMTAMVNNAHQVKEHFKINYNEQIPKKNEDIRENEPKVQNFQKSKQFSKIKFFIDNYKNPNIFQSSASSVPKQRFENTDIFVTREITNYESNKPKTKNNPFKTTVSEKPNFGIVKQNQNVGNSEINSGEKEKKNSKQFFYALVAKGLEKEQKVSENINKTSPSVNLPHIEIDKVDLNLNNNHNHNINNIHQKINENHSFPIQKGSQIPKFKENYLDLLIKSAEDLIESGLKLNELRNIKPSSLHSQTNHNNKHTKHTSSPNFFNFKCENKVCPVIVTKKSNIYQAKMGTFKSKVLWLCSQCHQAWKNGQFCYYCGVIYREYRGTKGFNDHKSWIGCEYCKNWEHIQCEESKGVYTNLSQLIKKDKHFKYKCPFCRKKNSNDNNKNSSRKDSIGGKDETSSLHIKRKNDGEINFKRPIKKKKEYDGYENNIAEKNDIYDDVKEIIHLDEELQLNNKKTNK